MSQIGKERIFKTFHPTLTTKYPITPLRTKTKIVNNNKTKIFEDYQDLALVFKKNSL